MDLITMLYLIDVIAGLSEISGLTLALSLTVTIILSTWQVFLSEECSLKEDTYNKERIARSKVTFERNKKTFKITLITLLISILISVMLPSKKTMYIAVGLKAAGDVANSEMGKKAQDVILKKLDSYLSENTEKSK